ncbi:MFS transporter [Amycolatopsis sp. QT-25]|uniref:MFS transporter n=1 Tax=Amycolatopsis sp. QT-25 TaxID=3034022 RepID=UPI0023EE13C2|nr:MFS transporter [Amycolatopsis sp. QT-25]WET76716.1 MFS transporter [Amycolatopsis sp. QT-25]
MQSRAGRLTTIGALSLVSDIGYSFFFAGLGTLLLDRGTSVQDLALINLLGILYFCRFMVGPVVDQYGFARLGHYRGWLICTQVIIVAVLLALAMVDPIENMALMLTLMSVVLFVSSVNDTAINGLAVRLIPPEEHGIANGVQVATGSLSIIIGSGGALLLYSWIGWGPTLITLAAVFLAPLSVLLTLREPAGPPTVRGLEGWSSLWRFFRQARTGLFTLLVVPVFVLGDWVAYAPQTAILLDHGWSVEKIGLVQYTVATSAQVVAALAAGWLVTRLGRRRFPLWAGAAGVVGTVLLFPVASGLGRAGTGGAVFAAGVLVLLAAVYGAKLTWVSTVSMALARPEAPATEYTVPMSMLGLMRVLANSLGLASVALAGLPWVLGSASALGIVGTVAVMAWAQRSVPRLSEPATV